MGVLALLAVVVVATAAESDCSAGGCDVLSQVIECNSKVSMHVHSIQVVTEKVF